MKKKEIRKQLIKKWKNLSEKRIQELSLKSFEKLSSQTDIIEADEILIFVAQKHELDLLPLFVKHFPDKTYYLPIIEGKTMTWGKLESLESLKPNRWGILEPRTETIPSDLGKTVMVMPGVGANLKGYRIGFGGGFYDRWLSKHKVAKTYFCVPDWAVVEFQEEIWDKRVEEVVVV